MQRSGRATSTLVGRPAVLGVAGIVGRDHRSWSVAGDERPAVPGLEVVVVVAERVEAVETRLAGVGPSRSRWSFSKRKLCPQPSTRQTGDCHHNATCCATRRGPSQVRDVHHVDTFGDHQLQDRVRRATHERYAQARVRGQGDRRSPLPRPHPVRTRRSRSGEARSSARVWARAARPSARAPPARRASSIERVERIRLSRFPAPIGPRRGEQLVR